MEPHLPEDWPGWTGEWELDRGRLSIQVSRGRELSVRLDGREIRDGVPLRELTGDHRLEVTAVPGNGKLCFSAKDVITLFCFQEGNSLLKGHRKRGTPPFVQRKESDL